MVAYLYKETPLANFLHQKIDGILILLNVDNLQCFIVELYCWTVLIFALKWLIPKLKYIVSYSMLSWAIAAGNRRVNTFVIYV